jgi:hypothetical protein
VVALLVYLVVRLARKDFARLKTLLEAGASTKTVCAVDHA